MGDPDCFEMAHGGQVSTPGHLNYRWATELRCTYLSYMSTDLHLLTIEGVLQ